MTTNKPIMFTAARTYLRVSGDVISAGSSKMVRHVLFTALIMLFCNLAFAADGSSLEAPAISMKQAIERAEQHVKSEKIDISKHYLASAEWQHRFGLVSSWRLEWRMKQQVKGGQIIVTVDANGKVEHGFGE